VSREFLSDAAEYLLAVGMTAAAYVVAISVITRLLSVDEYGQFQFVVSAAGFVSTLAIGWITPAIIRFQPTCRTPEDEIALQATVLKLSAAAILTAVAARSALLALGKSVLAGQLVLGLFVGGVATVESSSVVLLTGTRARREIGWFLVFTGWCNVGRLVTGLALVAVAGLGVAGMLGGWLLTVGAALPVMLAVTVGWTPVRLARTPVKWPLVRELAHYGAPVMAMTFLTWVLSLSDRHILGLLRDMHEVGICGASYEMAGRSLFQIIAVCNMAADPLLVTA